ncbi:phage major capsid protein [Bacillus cereus]|uniref:phage major capsid family protein n=1 Tax=Bacillus cereus TaxID=1396 RepID=UPI000BF83F1F|nr:phage major capsid protein [Bacillus cereus]EKS8377889.1 phage major capsid protein [Bacillus cereus]EKS8383283.1 phage major capsid protein [Bacillus cereus]PES69567.1 major capsid protein [Bacillus cereus]
MTMTNAQLLKRLDRIEKAAMATSGMNAGLLSPEQSKEFFRMAFDSTPFSQLHRKATRKAKQGELDKIAIGGRILRKKTENSDDGYRAGVETSKIEYNTKPIRLPWEITEELLRENIEGENFEDVVMELMATQTGIDLEDLHWNGDLDSSDPFLNINDGWLKKIKKSKKSHIVDHAKLVTGTGEAATANGFGKGSIFALSGAMPNKYKNSNLRWIMSPNRREKWIEYLTDRPTGAGDAALLGAGDQVNKPMGYGIVTVPSLTDDVILLADPKNFIAVNTYDTRVRKTTEGKTAVMEDKRFYVIHFDDDAVIQEMDAVAILTNIPDTFGA